MTGDELWEVLKQVAGANSDKTKIKSLVMIKRRHCIEAVKLINNSGNAKSGD